MTTRTGWGATFRGAVLVTVGVAEIHREPAHASEITTQALLGERLRVLAVRDEGRWLDVRLPDGYRGWLRSWLAAPDIRSWPGTRVVEVDEPLTWLRSAPDAAAEPICDLVIGARLATGPRAPGGWVGARLPDGREGFLPMAHLLGGGPRARSALRRPKKVRDLLLTARRFLGVPYVWGGKSPKGFDCSGLTQLVHGLHDLSIPRDAKEQGHWFARHAEVLNDPLRVPPGGLLFFGKHHRQAGHVGFSLGNGDLLHAQGRVKLQSMDPSNVNYNKDLSALFLVGHSPHPGLVALDSGKRRA